MLFLLLQLGDQRYAIAAGDVHEVVPVVAIRPLAHAPDGVAGVADYRGKPLPVVDLGQVVLSRRAESRLSTRLLVVRYGDECRLLGLIAERVTEVVHGAAADFQPCGITSGRAPYLGDVARLNGALVQRLDVNRLLPPAVRDVLFQTDDAHDGAH